MTLIDQLDKPTGLQLERGFWRHPTSGVIVMKNRDGTTKWWGAPSGAWKSTGENTYNLQKWSERQVAVGMVLLGLADEIVLPVDLSSRDARSVLDALVVDAKREAGATLAADRGSHAHLLTELRDLDADWIEQLADGADLGLTRPLQQAIVAAWEALLNTHGLDVNHIEQTVACERLLLAGTLDRTATLTKPLTFERPNGDTVTIPADTRIVLDVKTGGLKTSRDGHPNYWDSYALQILAYADSSPVTIDPHDPKGETWGHWDVPPSLEHAVIAHIDIASAVEGDVVPARLVHVDLTTAEQLADTYDAVKTARKLRPFSAVASPDVVVAFEPDGPHWAHSDVIDWLQQRIDTIGQHPQARKTLSKHWASTGAVTPKQGTAPSHVDRVVDLLDRIEAHHQIAFSTPDPRRKPENQ